MLAKRDEQLKFDVWDSEVDSDKIAKEILFGNSRKILVDRDLLDNLSLDTLMTIYDVPGEDSVEDLDEETDD